MLIFVYRTKNFGLPVHGMPPDQARRILYGEPTDDTVFARSVDPARITTEGTIAETIITQLSELPADVVRRMVSLEEIPALRKIVGDVVHMQRKYVVIAAMVGVLDMEMFGKLPETDRLIVSRRIVMEIVPEARQWLLALKGQAPRT